MTNQGSATVVNTVFFTKVAIIDVTISTVVFEVFDIDCFKTINETRDGNAILLDIVGILSAMLGNRGLMFRWAGDEFVFFLEMEGKEAEDIFKQICATIKNRLDVTISVGIVEVDLTESIKTNYHRAVQLCYTVKEHGGNGVKRK